MNERGGCGDIDIWVGRSNGSNEIENGTLITSWVDFCFGNILLCLRFGLGEERVCEMGCLDMTSLPCSIDGLTALR